MFIARPDAELHVQAFGQGPASLLAIGGWVGPGALWLDMFGHLPHRRCVALDHRGSGHSQTLNGPITLQAMADDLVAVADALDLRDCLLAAESSGVGVALMAARQAPARFAGLVLCGGAWQRAEPDAIDAQVRALQSDHDGFLRRFVAACLPESPGPSLRHWGLQLLRQAPLQRAIQLMQTRLHLDLVDALPHIDLPTLVLHGQADAIVPPDASWLLAERLPKARLQLLAGLGHVPMATAPAEVARWIDQAFPAAVPDR